jgi:SAM-dependent methyltransferase
MLGDFKFFEWGLSIGTLRDPQLASLAPALPPQSLRQITAEPVPELFLWSGLVDVYGILETYERYRTIQSARPRILDFGCGCGRLLRFLVGLNDMLEFHGADVNPAHIEWCREHLAPIAFEHNSPHPPLPYADATFDCIWSLSVFTHLDDGMSASWRRELARVLVKDGILIATTHGEVALSRIASEPSLAAMVRFDAERIAMVRRSLESRGAAFVLYDADCLASAQAGDSYGIHFARADHIRSWEDDRFAFVGHFPGALRGWQDVTVLRRR